MSAKKKVKAAPPAPVVAEAVAVETTATPVGRELATDEDLIEATRIVTTSAGSLSLMLDDVDRVDYGKVPSGFSPPFKVVRVLSSSTASVKAAK